MHRINRQIVIFILPAAIAWLLSSCYPEYKLGKEFIESKPELSVLLIPADYVFKNNLKRNEIGDTAGMTSDEIDSALLANSIFLNEISDSVLLETFINSMLNEFQKLGINVFLNPADSFLFLPSPAFVLHIAQLELEEFRQNNKDSEVFEDVTYYKTIKTNALSFNSWFELSWLNPKKEGRKLFFASETIGDIVDGYFTQNLLTGEVFYKYDLIGLDTAVIYRFSDLLGKRYAAYTFDYLMNQYIKRNLRPEVKMKYYMHYDRSSGLLEPTWDERFEIMEE
jgi:hypothetical protein